MSLYTKTRRRNPCRDNYTLINLKVDTTVPSDYRTGQIAELCVAACPETSSRPLMDNTDNEKIYNIEDIFDPKNITCTEPSKKSSYTTKTLIELTKDSNKWSYDTVKNPNVQNIIKLEEPLENPYEYANKLCNNGVINSINEYGDKFTFICNKSELVDVCKKGFLDPTTNECKTITSQYLIQNKFVTPS